MSDERPVVIVGAGGHGRVVLEALVSAGATVIGFTDSNETIVGRTVDGVPVLGNDDIVFSHSPEDLSVAIGIGSTQVSTGRQNAYETFIDAGYHICTVLHPQAIVSPSAEVGQGAQVMAGSIVQAGVVLGVNCIINTGAVVDHDCVISDHVHVAPGAILCGNIKIGEKTHVGAGVTIVQGMTVGPACMIAAGAVVVENAGAYERLSGVPARKS